MGHHKRMVITGMGALSPVGNDVPSLWQAMKQGRSGVAPITHFDAAPYETRFAAEVKGFDALQFIGKKEARRMDRFVQFAIAATQEALADAGLEITPQTAERGAAGIGRGLRGVGRGCDRSL